MNPSGFSSSVRFFRHRKHAAATTTRPFCLIRLPLGAQQGLMVGARAFPNNPYDAHTLAERIEQTTILLQDVTGEPKPKTVLVDQGCRGVDHELAPVQVIHRGKAKSLTKAQRRWLKRRQAVEPAIGHALHDHGQGRCYLKGAEGDALHAVLCAAGYNLRWLLRAISRMGLKAVFFRRILLRWLAALLDQAAKKDRQVLGFMPLWAGNSILQGRRHS